MYILGLNGWLNQSHDASACLVKDGAVICMVEEERLTRQKRSYDRLPILSSLYCLDFANISLKDVDIVAIGWDYKEKYHIMNQPWSFSKNELLEIYFPLEIFGENRLLPELTVIPHHLAHAASTYRTSGFNSAAIIVVDGQGERSSTTLAEGNGNRIEILEEFSIYDSLGYFFEAFCQYLGFRSHDGGKLMGLASYGKSLNTYLFDISKGYVLPGYDKGRLTQLNGDPQKIITQHWIKKLTMLFGRPNTSMQQFNSETLSIDRKVSISAREKNLAALAQHTLQNSVLHLVDVAMDLAHSNNVCLSGGVALNCSVNGAIANSERVEKLHIVPAAGDSGVALGAALEAWAALGQNPNFKLRDVYWGPEFTEISIKRVLEELKLDYEYVSEPANVAANLLVKDYVVGWFQGKLEVGPRALGNRSILGNPRNSNSLSRINKIKGREMWRPLAPAVIEEEYQNYFDLKEPSSFMLLSCLVKKKKRDEIPAVVHVDGTARPQVVVKKDNKSFWQLIYLFGKQTGTPVVINTSFNIGEEPIVCSPKDALKTFYASSIDCLFIGNYLLKK